MSIYLVNVDHDFEDESISVLYGLHAPDVNNALLNFILLICLWDKENCLETHSGGNGLSKTENLNELINSMCKSKNRIWVNHKEKHIEVNKIEKLDNKDADLIMPKLEKYIIEFLSDEPRFCAVGRLYDFVRCNELTINEINSLEVQNTDLNSILKFLVEKHSKKEEYSMDWLVELEKIVF